MVPDRDHFYARGSRTASITQITAAVTDWALEREVRCGGISGAVQVYPCVCRLARGSSADPNPVRYFFAPPPARHPWHTIADYRFRRPRVSVALALIRGILWLLTKLVGSE